MLRTRPSSFKYTCAVTTGFNNCHKFIHYNLIAHFKCLPPEKVVYGDFKQFSQESFLRDVEHEILRGSFYQGEERYAAFSAVCKFVIDKHVPLKKLFRNNHAPIMTKELTKATMNRYN